MKQYSKKLLKRLNERAFKRCCSAVSKKRKLDLIVHDVAEASVLDFAVGRTGTLAGGIALSDICMSGLADISILQSTDDKMPLPSVQVVTDYPIEACIASQYAGWAFSHEDYFAMCSGPARTLRGKEEVLEEYGLKQEPKGAVAIFETNKLPNEEAIIAFAKTCGVKPQNVTICIARSASLPGSTQVVARSVETTLHKLHELKFDLRSIKSAVGKAPLPPIAGDDMTSLCWTNDSILYGASVVLYVEAEDEAISKIGEQIPSSSSKDFGESFSEIFSRYEKDFYKIDKMLFSPAAVTINNMRTGKVFRFGAVRNDIVCKSFGI